MSSSDQVKNILSQSKYLDLSRALVRSGAVIDTGPPRPNFLCRSTRDELKRECMPLRITHVTGYGRCEQLFTLFFAYQ
jgi:hypothetical protein